MTQDASLPPLSQPRPADLFANLLASSAEASDLLEVAKHFAPFDHERPNAHSTLRQALVRSEATFSLAQLKSLAKTHQNGSQSAWSLADSPPLVAWLHDQLAERCHRRSLLDPELVCEIISRASHAALSRHVDAFESLPKALWRHSRRDRLGMRPVMAWLKAARLDLAQATLPEGYLAILEARTPEALELFLASGGDMRRIVEGEPLWKVLRTRALERSDNDLCQHVDQWASKHEPGAEEARKLREYFLALSRYGGESKLKERKDWTSVRDEHGRSAPMVVCLIRSANIKTFWEIKKAREAVATTDFEGRSLWHALLIHGKDAPPGCAAFLAEHVPLSPDRLGRGLVPSIVAMRDDNGRAYSEHDWMFSTGETAQAGLFAREAGQWFGCSRDEDSIAFAHWMANERWLSTHHTAVELVRSVSCFATLTMALDPASFVQLHPMVLGALCANLIMSSERPFGPLEKMERLRLMASLGADIRLSTESRAKLDTSRDKSQIAVLDQALEVAASRRELAGHIPDPTTLSSSPRSLLRI